jgi:RNA polymerase sigma-70 factor (ECF subfamily)
VPDAFEAERPRLLGLAYRMLGSLADAEDVVQDAWLRWASADQAGIDRPAAWLTTVTTRLALDRIRSLSRRREEYVGPWLPEPIALPAGERGPEEAAEVADSLTLGFLVVLDRLNPVERAVFLLADVFGEPYATIATAVGKSEEACRQVASRARRKVRDARPPEVGPASPALFGELLAAIATGEIDAVLRLLDADAVLVSDGGADRHAARRPVLGADRVARFLVNLTRRLPVERLQAVLLNGAPAVRIDLPNGPLVLAAEQRDGRVCAIRTFLNPEKLTHLDGVPSRLV